MGLFSWIVVGLLAGWIAGMVTGRRSQGCITKVVVGVIGALIGGALAQAAGSDEGVNDLDLRSLLIAVVGASIFLFVLEAIEGRRGNRRLP
jgi:uncharacterized membrane protein YeaQ/YmgE (transglycosylase-associated protein family)